MDSDFFRRPGYATVFSAVLVILLGWIDYLSGRDFGFFVFYYLPIAYTAWFAGLRPSIALAILSAGVWFAADFITLHNFSFFVFSLWNTLIRLLSFLLVSFFVGKISVLLSEEKKRTGELRQALSQIKTLRGFIPICSSCKKIRNDQGAWEQLEKYIGEHSEADFTHGICDACARKLYPSVYEKEDPAEAPPRAPETPSVNSRHARRAGDAPP